MIRHGVIEDDDALEAEYQASIQKFNQNHDENGLFTSGSMSVADAKSIRMLSAINREHLENLAASMRSAGKYVGEPVIVERFANGSRLITDGNHRVEAAKLAGVTSIPFHEYDSSTQAGRFAAGAAINEAERRKVQKFNQNHGADGRFASGEGSVYRVFGDDALHAVADSEMHTIQSVHRLKDDMGFKVVHTESPSQNAAYMPGENMILVNKRMIEPGDFAHEFGHRLDQYYKPKYTNGISETDRVSQALKRGLPVHSKLTGVVTAIRDSEGYKGITQDRHGGFSDYLRNPSEAFARAYMQYVGAKSGHPEWMGVKGQRGYDGTWQQWEDGDFAPISAEFDKLFTSEGLTP